MAWRFKASKYKNAAPIVPKPEACVRDVCVGSYQTYGNNICSSAAFMAFNWEHVGSSMAVLPLDDCGRKSKTMPLLHAHSDTITDMQFSPFHDGLLLTGSQDSMVKVWHIPPEGLKESLSTPECSLSHKQRRVENVGFHPVADGLIHVASGHELALWDLTKQQEAFVNRDHGEVIQSTSWKKDGKLLATSCKDKKVRIIDPRVDGPVLDVANSHQSIKDSRIVWLGEQDRILTTGFDAARLRQIIIRDVRNLSQAQRTLELDCSTGVLMPLFDADTNMLFLAGKGDTTILYMELTDRDPFLIEGLRHSGEQTKGACLVPKRAMRVMEGEVNRVLQLTGSSVIPIMYQVPRKSYRDYHADLYPDTSGAVTHLSAPMWLEKQDCPVPNISLRPDANSCGQVHRGGLDELVTAIQAMPPPKKTTACPKPVTHKPTIIDETPKPLPKAELTDEDRIDFVNVKDLIKDMERQKTAVSPNVPDTPTNGFSHNKNNGHTEKPDDSEDVESEAKSEEPQLPLSRSESLTNGAPLQPPKPLPRSSISEGGAGEEQGSEAPKPKPRTTAAPVSGYKPRLGPKPFSASQGSEEFSFDKVFSVPAVPGSVKGDSGATSPVTPAPTATSPKECPAAPASPSNDPAPPREGYTNGDAGEDSGHPPRTPRPAETRKCLDVKEECPAAPASPSNDPAPPREGYTNGDAGEDSGHPPRTPRPADTRKCLDVRDGSQSIADRRRAYEMRSVSVAVESETPPSPAPLRRRDSLKSRKSPERDDKRASVPNAATKRTSTVFGRVSKFRHLKGTPGHKSTMLENIKNISRQLSGECNGFYVSAFILGTNAATKRTSTLFGRVSKSRHLKGTPGHKSTILENIKNISRQLSGECNGFYANGVRCAVPVTGGGGRVAVIELPTNATKVSVAPPAHPGGLRPHALLHPAPLQDWCWDPFNDTRLLVACDDGAVREWIVPENGLQESTNEPHRLFSAHPDKIYVMRFHPTASDLLATAAHDLTVKIWNLSDDPPTCAITLTGHTEQIFAIEWSPCGEYLATVCKDGLIRIYKPRSSTEPLRSGPGPAGGRGGRVVWALSGTHLVVTGFDKVSERQIVLYSVENLSTPICTIGLDVSPAILQIHIDHDSGTLFLTGRGDSTIYCYEVTCEAPFLCPLSHHRSTTLHQGIAFLHKNLVAVEKVEFARALRLTNGNIEPLSFTVPRIKTELFQDDLFPPTLVTWQPWQSGAAWLRGERVAPLTKSLQPPGMAPLSSSTPLPQPKEPKDKPAQKPKPDLIKSHVPFDPKDKQDSIMKSMSAKVQINMKLEQDTMEGVDEAEWEQ